MSDSPERGQTLESAWLGFGQSLAVAGGALLALVSLLLHVPVWVAALRGALLFVALWAIVRLARSLFASLRADAARPRAASRPGSGKSQAERSTP
jgi:hypothetical protein